jgi:hypothetical protein
LDVDHRRFVQNDRVGGERPLLVALEAPGFGIGLQQPVDGLGRHTRRLAHPLGRPAGGGAELQLRALGGQDPQDAVQYGDLAHARTARDHRHLVGHDRAHRFLLAVGEVDTCLSLRPGDRIRGFDGRPGQGPGHDRSQTFRDALLGAVQPRQEDATRIVDGVRNDVALRQLVAQRAFDQLGGHLE